MNKLFGLGVFVAALHAPVSAVTTGDTYAQVIAEKGQPAGKLEAGGQQVLRYADLTVKLKDGRVTAVEVPAVRATTAAAAVAASAPAAAKSTTAPAKPAFTPASWSSDFRGALERAKAEKRHVFLFFTGSDWCGWCMRLQKEILTTREFASFAGEKLVLVELDFPKGKPIPDAVKAQNNNLARRFRIEGFPTVIVLDSEGKLVGKLGYQAGGPGPFIERLRQM